MLRSLIVLSFMALTTHSHASESCKDLTERSERVSCQYKLLKGNEFSKCNGVAYNGLVLIIEHPKKDVEDIKVREYYFFSNLNMTGVLTFEIDKDENATFIASRNGHHAFFNQAIRITNSNGEFESLISDFNYSSLDILGNPKANIIISYMHPTFEETMGDYEEAKIDRFPYTLRQIRKIAGDQFQENICR